MRRDPKRFIAPTQRYRLVRSVPVWAQPLAVLWLGFADGRWLMGAKHAWIVFRFQWFGEHR